MILSPLLDVTAAFGDGGIVDQWDRIGNAMRCYGIGTERYVMLPGQDIG